MFLNKIRIFQWNFRVWWNEEKRNSINTTMKMKKLWRKKSFTPQIRRSGSYSSLNKKKLNLHSFDWRSFPFDLILFEFAKKKFPNLWVSAIFNILFTKTKSETWFSRLYIIHKTQNFVQSVIPVSSVIFFQVVFWYSNISFVADIGDRKISKFVVWYRFWVGISPFGQEHSKF